MERREFNEGEIIKHFKRELLATEELLKEPTKYLYRYIGVSTHTETEEKTVVYQAMYGDCKIYNRPYDMFYGEVDKEKYPESNQKYRLESFVEGLY